MSSGFDVAAAEKYLDRFYDARDEGMDHETGFDFAHSLADDLNDACAYIRKLEAVRDSAGKLMRKSHCEDVYTSGLDEALAALDEDK